MSDRLYKLAERQQSNRSALTWFGLAAAGALIAAIAMANNAQAAEPQAAKPQAPIEAGVMVRPGTWTQGNGSYIVPAALGSDPRSWPATGWYRVTNKEGALQVQAVPTPARGLPDFLREIAQQVSDPAAHAQGRPEGEAEAIDTRYIRVPGVALAQGRLPAVSFSRGVLTPKLDHAYELELGGKPFLFAVQNGLRNKAGVPYGDGAVYTVQSGGETWNFHVPGNGGWESRVLAVADLDGDGKPDFIVQVGDQETLLLSSKATQPGMNPPAAVLAMLNEGC